MTVRVRYGGGIMVRALDSRVRVSFGGDRVRALDRRLTQNVADSTPGRFATSASGNNRGQVVRIGVLLPPSSMTRYRLRGGDALRLGR